MSSKPGQPPLRSSDSYVETFDARGDLYNAAAKIQPQAREIERAILMGLLDLRPDHIVVDAPAGGGYLADAFREVVSEPSQIICIEPSKKFSRPITDDVAVYNCSIADMPLPNGSVDRIGSLAGLHHIDPKVPFFLEANRILKPGGIVSAGDVLAGTAVAEFLNGPVDRFTESGHEGVFVELGQFTQWFDSVGLEPLEEKYHEFFWEFDSVDNLVTYCHNLFGMTKANLDQVHDALFECFKIEQKGGRVCLPWGLTYGVGRKTA